MDSFVEFREERYISRFIFENLLFFLSLFSIILYPQNFIKQIIYLSSFRNETWKRLEKERELESKEMSCLVIWFRLWILYKWKRPVNDGTRMRVEDKQGFNKFSCGYNKYEQTLREFCKFNLIGKIDEDCFKMILRKWYIYRYK